MLLRSMRKQKLIKNYCLNLKHYACTLGLNSPVCNGCTYTKIIFVFAGWILLSWILLLMIVKVCRNKNPDFIGIRCLELFEYWSFLSYINYFFWFLIQVIRTFYVHSKKYVKLNNSERVTASGKVIFIVDSICACLSGWSLPFSFNFQACCFKIRWMPSQP